MCRLWPSSSWALEIKVQVFHISLVVSRHPSLGKPLSVCGGASLLQAFYGKGQGGGYLKWCSCSVKVFIYSWPCWVSVAERAFLWLPRVGATPLALRGLLAAVASPAVERARQGACDSVAVARGLSSCNSRALEHGLSSRGAGVSCSGACRSLPAQGANP